MLKYKCIYNTSDTSGVQHMYTIHPAGPLGQATETIAQRAKVLSDIQSHRVQVELIFTWMDGWMDRWIDGCVFG